MSESTNNPLSTHFRVPVIYLTLPSKGKYWPEGALNLPINGELPVLSMTTRDEITIRTPDALLNGQGVVDVIKSCIPGIVDPWNMPSVDVDAALIAIRIASYSNEMDVDAKCPHCEAVNTYSVDLHQILSNIRCPNFDNTVEISGLRFKFAPQKYFQVNKANQIEFEEQKLLAAIKDPLLDDEAKTAQFAGHLQRIIDITNQIFVNSTESITMPTGDVVTNQAYISEFYKETARGTVAKVKELFDTFNEEAMIKPIKVGCPDCEKSFEVSITFDYANFFA